ncbi:MAG: hypothetical protein ACKO5Q_21570 [Microcystaceae cyanobacterium]
MSSATNRKERVTPAVSLATEELGEEILCSPNSSVARETAGVTLSLRLVALLIAYCCKITRAKITPG